MVTCQLDCSFSRALSAHQKDVRLYRRQNQRLMDDIARYININNRLWCALAKLDGGLEAARKITLPQRKLP